MRNETAERSGYMKDVPLQDVVLGLIIDPEFEHQIRVHMAVLGHDRLGVTELRAIVDGRHWVAYADSVAAVLELCRQMEGRASAVYVGVQPRPAHLHDLAPNCWVLARGGPEGNCARDADVEFVTAMYFDIDVLSPQRQEGHPASDQELQKTFRAAQKLSRQEGLALNSAIGCSGNGHCVLAPLVPIAVGSEEIARQFRIFCQGLADTIAEQLMGVRIDAVYNLSRIMRVMGTVNRKDEALPGRPHRRACFVTEPPRGRSLALHFMILNTDTEEATKIVQPMPQGLKCDLARIEKCEFVRFCRRNARLLSEPQWVAAVTNLAPLEGGVPLIHEISALDPVRYDSANTQRLIDRVQREGYRPFSCRTIVSSAMTRPGRSVFHCSRIGRCPARAPMYMAAIRAIQQE